MNEGSGQVIHDWSGNGNAGQLGDSPGVDTHDPEWIPGVLFGSALRFTGDDFITVPDSPSLDPETVTVAAWFRGTASPGTNRYLVAKGAFRCDHAAYALYTSSTGGLAFYVDDGTHWRRSPEAPASVWDGKWHNAAGTFDGTTVRLYIDGTEVGAGTPTVGSTIAYNSTNSDGNFGGYSDGTCTPSLYFTGDVDGVQIWSRALPVDNIWRFLSSLFTRSR